MDAQFPDTPGILDGWKDIASYLGRSPRTVQRWERDLDLPIHRIPTLHGGAVVYALRAELDGWRSRQSVASLGQPGGATAAPVVETGVAPELAELPVARLAPDPPATAPGFLRRVANAAIPVWAALGLAGVAVLTFIALGSAR